MRMPNELDPYHYEVEQGEEVVFHITATGTAALVRMILDGQQGLSFLFKFKVTKATGQRHVLATEFSFSPGSGSEAQYEIRISGSKGGGFPLPPISTATRIRDPGFGFKVV